MHSGVAEVATAGVGMRQVRSYAALGVRTFRTFKYLGEHLSRWRAARAAGQAALSLDDRESRAGAAQVPRAVTRRAIFSGATDHRHACGIGVHAQVAFEKTRPVLERTCVRRQELGFERFPGIDVLLVGRVVLIIGTHHQMMLGEVRLAREGRGSRPVAHCLVGMHGRPLRYAHELDTDHIVDQHNDFDISGDQPGEGVCAKRAFAAKPAPEVGTRHADARLLPSRLDLRAGSWSLPCEAAERIRIEVVNPLQDTAQSRLKHRGEHALLDMECRQGNPPSVGEVCLTG